MGTHGTGVAGRNSLRRPIEIAVEGPSAAGRDAVYRLLADPGAHLGWGGDGARRSSYLLSMQAARSPLGVGDEFETTGVDPMGRFTDRSVVTAATPPAAFEFVTEAVLTTKRGACSAWTIVHRYTLEPEGRGCHISYAVRITRIDEMPGLLRVFNWPVLGSLGVRASAGLARRGVLALAAMAEERSAA